MSQSIFPDINPNTTSGTQLATLLNDFKEALMTSLSGASRPSELLEGGVWLDTSADPIWVLKMYDGTVDIDLMTIDSTNASSSVPGASSIFTITKTSADTVSPILELLKERIINNGQVLGGDYVGTIQMKGNADDMSVPITVRIRGIATQNYTATTAGTDLVFEATSSGSVAIAEVMRIKNGRLGIGTTAPTESLHVVGNGIRSERSADDTTPAKVISRKKKATGTGQTLSSEEFGQYEFNSTDQNGAEVLAAKIVAVAAENHTDVAQGTLLEIWNKDVGAAAFSQAVGIGDIIELYKSLDSFEAAAFWKYITLQGEVDSTTTGSDQSIAPTKSFLKVTNASLASINNIAAPADGRLLALHNSTGSLVTLVNDSGGTAANRILTGTGANLSLTSGTGIFLLYDLDSSRWRVFGGTGSSSGGGGGGGAVWQPVAGNGAIADYEYDEKVWKFEQGQLQKLILWRKVPTGFVAGVQKYMKINCYSPGTTNNWRFQAVTTLIKKSTNEAVTSTTNQNTANSGDIANVNANGLNELTISLTDGSGLINSQSISAGDMLKIELSRIAPAGAEDTNTVRFIESSTEVGL